MIYNIISKSYDAEREKYCIEVVVRENDNVILHAMREYYTPDEAIAMQCVENEYLFDLRRNNKKFNALELPIDITFTTQYGEGWTDTNKGFIAPAEFVPTEGWIASTYAGRTFYTPPREWTPPVLEVHPIDIS